jgi:hypothetical protein
MKPTVGRIVYFNDESSNKEVVHRASIITFVHDEKYVDLMVFMPNYIESKILIDQGEGFDQWDWMPYQKGQVEKYNELVEQHKGVLGTLSVK